MTENAQKLAALGWQIFPAPVGTKKSHVKSRDGQARWGASSDPATVAGYWQTWPSANIGVACGHASGIWCLDIDTPDGHAADGHAALRDLIQLHGPLPHTVSSVSPSGSVHFYFRWPADREIRNSEGRVAPGIDVRGEGGMVIAPPSVKPDGHAYQWQDRCDPWSVSPAHAPTWLLDAVTATPRAAMPAPHVPGRVSLDEIRDLLDAIDPDADGYDQWRGIIAAVHQETGGSDEGLALADEWSQRGEKYQPGEIARKWSSFRVTPGGNGIGTIGAACRAAGGDPVAIQARHALIGASSDYRPAGMTDAPAFDPVSHIVAMIEPDPTRDLSPLVQHVTPLSNVDRKRLYERLKPFGLATALRDLVKASEADTRRERTLDAGLIADSNGVPIPNLENVRRILTTQDDWRGTFQVNEFDGQIWITRPEIRQAIDTDFLSATGKLQASVFPSIGTQTVRDGVATAALDATFHPVRDYLSSVAWDGTARLYRLFTDYFHCHIHDEIDGHADYVAAAGQRFCIGAVARIFQPGCKVDTMPTLSGAQGLKKSTGIATLTGQAWFGDDMPDMTEKDAKQWLRGRWIAEIAELASIKGKEVEHIKSFLSTAEDRYRAAYGRTPETVPRQTVFAGTVNEDEYLADATGGRRFWPLRVVSSVDLGSIARDRDQLWAEAVALYRAGWRWWFDQGECPALENMQNHARLVDVDETRVAEWLRYTPGEVSAAQVAEALFDRERGDKATSMRIARYLKALGWEHVRKTDGVRKWQRTSHAEPYQHPAISGNVTPLHKMPAPLNSEKLR